MGILSEFYAFYEKMAQLWVDNPGGFIAVSLLIIVVVILILVVVVVICPPITKMIRSVTHSLRNTKISIQIEDLNKKYSGIPDSTTDSHPLEEDCPRRDSDEDEPEED